MSEPFNPIQFMLHAIEEADRNRNRIVAWDVNPLAAVQLARMDQDGLYSDERTLEKSIYEREYLGIPLRFRRRWLPNDEPRMEAALEHYGSRVLIHDYDGDILHGNALTRFRRAAKLPPQTPIVAHATTTPSHSDTENLLDPQDSAI